MLVNTAREMPILYFRILGGISQHCLPAIEALESSWLRLKKQTDRVRYRQETKKDLILRLSYRDSTDSQLSMQFGIHNLSVKTIQKQPPRGVSRKRRSENMQQIYMRTPMPKCDYNKVALQLYCNRTLAWVFSCKFAAYFQNTFS